MCGKPSSLSPALLVALPMLLSGCGIRDILPVNEMPSLNDYSRIALIFYTDKPSKEYGRLPILLSYSVGTELSIYCENKEWIFDRSEQACPVSDRLNELGIRPFELYQNYCLAMKLSQAVQADLVVLGHIEEPELFEEGSRDMEYRMSRVDITGPLIWHPLYQTAILRANLQIIDGKSGRAIWEGKITGFKNYMTWYRAGDPVMLMPERSMLTEVQRDLVKEIFDRLYPAMNALDS